ncbi:hypothetical protein SAMN05661077_1594 [Thiohalorhabdus denitrificans]|uniref:Uncharacterized protein n=1 Tax=Thiohalorhabdus denitrificans TaxID=381306 RepID=A0A1G5EE05_9GAMM|nr:hypothetical protein SAMN05661077_1594 [Thiohalorhabdus denitrificans]
MAGAVVSVVLGAGLTGCGDADESSGDPAYIVMSGGTHVVKEGSEGNLRYKDPWTVLVTSTDGQPVEGAVINLRVVTTSYTKGVREWDTEKEFWKIEPTAGPCANEDRNLNGTLDSGEDANGNGVLDPRNVATFSGNVETTEESNDSVTVGRITTDERGYADFFVVYGTEFGHWATVSLTAETQTTGTEGSQSRAFGLPVAQEDVEKQDEPPVGEISPFGDGASC